MSILSRSRSGGCGHAAEAAAKFDHWEPSGSPYLTDGVKLYRYVGGVPSRRSEIVALDDCRSLKTLLFSLEELRALDLRTPELVSSESAPRAPEELSP
jgi:hypothetical protein